MSLSSNNATAMGTQAAAATKLQAFVRGCMSRMRVSELIVRLIEELEVIMELEKLQKQQQQQQQPTPQELSADQEASTAMATTRPAVGAATTKSTTTTTGQTKRSSVSTSSTTLPSALDEKLNQYVEAAVSPQRKSFSRVLSIDADPLKSKVAQYMQETQSPKPIRKVLQPAQYPVQHLTSTVSPHAVSNRVAALKSKFTADTPLSPMKQPSLSVAQSNMATTEMTTATTMTASSSTNDIHSVYPPTTTTNTIPPTSPTRPPPESRIASLLQLQKSASQRQSLLKQPTTPPSSTATMTATESASMSTTAAPRRKSVLDRYLPAQSSTTTNDASKLKQQELLARRGSIIPSPKWTPAAPPPSLKLEPLTLQPKSVLDKSADTVHTTGQEENDDDDEDDGDDEQLLAMEYANYNASTTVTALVRGYLARKKFKALTWSSKSLTARKQAYLESHPKRVQGFTQPEAADATQRQTEAAAKLKARQNKIQMAAIKIQAVVRGFLVRSVDFREALAIIEKLEFFRSLGLPTIPGNEPSAMLVNNEVSEEAQRAVALRKAQLDQAATVIQTRSRGYLTRKFDVSKMQRVMEYLKEYYQLYHSDDDDDAEAIKLKKEILPEPTEKDLEQAWTAIKHMNERILKSDETAKLADVAKVRQLLSTWDWIKAKEKAIEAALATDATTTTIGNPRSLLDRKAPRTGELVAFTGWLAESGLVATLPGIVVEDGMVASASAEASLDSPTKSMGGAGDGRRTNLHKGEGIQSNTRSDGNDGTLSATNEEASKPLLPSILHELAKKLTALSAEGKKLPNDERHAVVQEIRKIIHERTLNFDEVLELWSFLDIHNFDMTQFKRDALEMGIIDPTTLDATELDQIQRSGALAVTRLEGPYVQYIDEDLSKVYKKQNRLGSGDEQSPRNVNKETVMYVDDDYSSIYRQNAESRTDDGTEKDKRPIPSSHVTYVDEDFSEIYAQKAGPRPSMEAMVTYYGFTKQTVDIPHPEGVDDTVAEQPMDLKKRSPQNNPFRPWGTDRNSDKMLSTLKWLEQQGVRVDETVKLEHIEDESVATIELDIEELTSERNSVKKEDLSDTVKWLTNHGFTKNTAQAQGKYELQVGGLKTLGDLDVTEDDELETMEKEIKEQIATGKSGGAPTVQGLNEGLSWLQKQARRSIQAFGAGMGTSTAPAFATFNRANDGDASRGIDASVQDDGGESRAGEKLYDSNVLHSLSWLKKHGFELDGSNHRKPTEFNDESSTVRQAPNIESLVDALAQIDDHEEAIQEQDFSSSKAKNKKPIGTERNGPKTTSPDDISNALKWLAARGIGKNVLKTKVKEQRKQEVQEKKKLEVGELKILPDLDMDESSGDEVEGVGGKEAGAMQWLKKKGLAVNTKQPSEDDFVRAAESFLVEMKAQGNNSEKPGQAPSTEEMEDTVKFLKMRPTENSMPSMQNHDESPWSPKVARAMRFLGKTNDKQLSKPLRRKSRDAEDMDKITAALKPPIRRKSQTYLTDRGRPVHATSVNDRTSNRSKERGRKEKKKKEKSGDDSLVIPAKKKEKSPDDSFVFGPGHDSLASILSDARSNDSCNSMSPADGRKKTRSRSRNSKGKSEKERRRQDNKEDLNKSQDLNKSLAWLHAKSLKSPTPPSQVLRTAGSRRASTTTTSVMPGLPNLDLQSDQRKAKVVPEGERAELNPNPKSQADLDYNHAVEWLNNSSTNLEDAAYFKRLDGMLPKKASQSQADRAREMAKALNWVKKQGLMTKGGKKNPEPVASATSEMKASPLPAKTRPKVETPLRSPKGKGSKAPTLIPSSHGSGSSRNVVSLKELQAQAAAREKTIRPTFISTVGSSASDPETRDYENALLFLAAFEKGGNEWEHVDDGEHFKKLNNMIPLTASQSTEERAQKMCKMLGFLKKKGKV